MGQRPIAIRLKQKSEAVNMSVVEAGSTRANHAVSDAHNESVEGHNATLDQDKSCVVCSVSEAARRLGVSERTIFRLLKSEQLERVKPENDDQSLSASDGINVKFDIAMSDKKMSLFKQMRSEDGKLSVEMSDINGNMTDKDAMCKFLGNQIREKDIQISQMLRSQQEMAQTIQRLQEQMFELAHLVLTHNVAAAQAKTESEIKAQEHSSRRGLTNLLGVRNRR